ncbi:cobyrinate a,c-diamide synthase [Paenibacillus chitinolyticus]|uniref:cobyrinate a,c-diamide synthase n=1 Tax=Paenibacillus chitinolyticus TaxID=79263 RepID=UPI00362B5DFD
MAAEQEKEPGTPSGTAETSDTDFVQEAGGPIVSRAKRLLIAGTGSGVGKTTVTIGVMAALKARGLSVQGFKCGPDYIDPTYHTAVTGRLSRNLDSWMLPADTVREIYCRASRDADIAVIEGVMGFYDGKNPKTNEGSSAEISLLLQCPVILVVNCKSMARSAAAIVKGFQLLDPRVRIAGVFANLVGSEGHYRIVRDAIEQECGVPVIGYMLRDENLAMPERHLGLVPSIGRGELSPFFSQLAERISAHTDLERLLQVADTEPLEASARIFRPLEADGGGTAPEAPRSPLIGAHANVDANAAHEKVRPPEPRVRIAVAKDAAFHFYYQENLELLQACGAELVYFSPLAGEKLPGGVDGLYLGGGFPEEFAERLAELQEMKQSIAEGIESGLPTLAECGGYMFLTDAIVDTSGKQYPMLGLVPGKVTMQTKLAALGYREATGTEGNFLLGPGDTARGHEFHYSVFEPAASATLPPAYKTKGMRGSKEEGALKGSLVSGYTHLHFASNPDMPRRWIEKCLLFRKMREGLV